MSIGRTVEEDRKQQNGRRNDFPWLIGIYIYKTLEFIQNFTRLCLSNLPSNVWLRTKESDMCVCPVSVGGTRREGRMGAVCGRPQKA